MAKLRSYGRRCFCAVCGEGTLLTVPEMLASGIGTLYKDTNEWIVKEMASRGWRHLGGRLWLCKAHSSLYERATEDDLRLLQEKFLAHRTASRFTLEFYIHNGRVVTETGSRSATAQETEMWGVLKRLEDKETPR